MVCASITFEITRILCLMVGELLEIVASAFDVKWQSQFQITSIRVVSTLRILECGSHHQPNRVVLRNDGDALIFEDYLMIICR